jgi:hypothetical protein
MEQHDDGADLKLITAQSQGGEKQDTGWHLVSIDILMDDDDSDMNKSTIAGTSCSHRNTDGEESGDNIRYKKTRFLHSQRRQQRLEKELVMMLNKTPSDQKLSTAATPRSQPRVSQRLLLAQKYNHFLLWTAQFRGGPRRRNKNSNDPESSFSAGPATMNQETANLAAATINVDRALDKVNMVQKEEEEDPNAASHTQISVRSSSSSPSSVVVELSSSFSSAATAAAEPSNDANTEVSSSEVVSSPQTRRPVFRERTASPKTRSGNESPTASPSWEENWPKQAESIQAMLDMAEQEEDEFLASLRTASGSSSVISHQLTRTVIRGIKAPAPRPPIVVARRAVKQPSHHQRTRRIMSVLVVDEELDFLENAMLVNGYYNVLKTSEYGNKHDERQDDDDDNDASESVISVLTMDDNDDRHDNGNGRRRQHRQPAALVPQPLPLDSGIIR